ncbi:sporulation peptidase YabG [Paenibacillus sp. N1-5-1-14]|uniref:sporulation peptidase YabG n=1 Tax=Paenibacillus radicibacter TaxID=2972488 RepID=UPI0021598669|nr:sporulation peptidase YabG [Paenibacillus radicibacter]MCR8645874.1 sporulation peptidase YabG [Paenibacillus radicibacter]
MRQGDLVKRKSYGGDIIFRVQSVDQTNQRVILRGVDYRLLADAPVADLIEVKSDQFVDSSRFHSPQTVEPMRRLVRERMAMYREQSSTPLKGQQVGNFYFEVPGKVLHLDGDPLYLRKCMTMYEDLHIPAQGLHMQESQMASALERLLPQVKPDIVVVTGHDGFIKNRSDLDIYALSSYKNSGHFVKAVEVARNYERNRDALIVVAGACQSHFEALLSAGANFASSPARVLIHALDPLFIASKVSYTPSKNTVSMLELMESTVTGLEGLGGVESRGCHRMGLPRLEKIPSQKPLSV